jgi:phosphatidylglycerophosphate synthase
VGIQIARQSILTPANAVTILGLTATVFGSIRLDTGIGFAAIVVGRLLDMLDGVVARHTGTSQFGAALDAVSDKFATLAIIIGAWYFSLVPVWFLVFLLMQHIAVAVVALYGSARRNIRPKVTSLGKNNMFLHMFTLVVFVGAGLLDGGLHSTITTFALLLAVGSVVSGLFTFRNYYAQVNS